jgi:HSP20 family protein
MTLSRAERVFGDPDDHGSLLEVKRMAVQTRPPDGQATVAPWDPLRELEEMQERMKVVMQTMSSIPTRLWAPLGDIEETEDAWVFEIELPGVKPDDISVELQGNELVVTGEIKERERKGILRRRTRRVGAFEYRAVVPSDVDPEKIEAKVRDGVLMVRVPKTERAQRRRISVKSS